MMVRHIIRTEPALVSIYPHRASNKNKVAYKETVPAFRPYPKWDPERPF